MSIHCKGFAEFIFSLLVNFRSVEGSGFASKNLTVNDASTIKSKPNNSNVLGRGKNCFLGARLCKLAARILVCCCICKMCPYSDPLGHSPSRTKSFRLIFYVQNRMIRMFCWRSGWWYEYNDRPTMTVSSLTLPRHALPYICTHGDWKQSRLKLLHETFFIAWHSNREVASMAAARMWSHF